MSYVARYPLRNRRHALIIAVVVGSLTTACGNSEDSVAPATSDVPASVVDLATPAEFSAFVDAHPDVPLINVHIPYEGHIEGTDAFIPFDSILESSDLPNDRSAPIALYCRSGNMSAQAAAALAEAGYTNLVDLDGGMIAWDASGNGLVDDPSAVDDV